MTQSTARGFLGAGDLYIAPFNPSTGAFDGFQGPYECSKFEIKASSDLKEMTSHSRTQYGQVIAAVSIPKPTEFSVTMAEINNETLTTALMGSQTPSTQASGTLTDSPITAKLDHYVQLPKQNLSDVAFEVTNSAGTTTYVLGTDYVVNWRLGMVKALSTGTIIAAEALLVSGTYNAIDGTMISGATQTQIRAQFMLDGINFVDGSPSIVRCPDCIMSSSAALDFLKSDFADAPLTGRVTTPIGAAAPFTVERRATA